MHTAGCDLTGLRAAVARWTCDSQVATLQVAVAAQRASPIYARQGKRVDSGQRATARWLLAAQRGAQFSCGFLSMCTRWTPAVGWRYVEDTVPRPWEQDGSLLSWGWP